VDVDNRDQALSAGLYGIVHLEVPRQEPVVTVPSQAIIFDKTGLSVAVVENGVVQIRHLDIAEDDGAEVQVRAGLKGGDVVILNPPTDVTPGMKVRS
jgi:multidrug efflux pump subunit AcrA (membrane-fusion protein)